MKGRPPTLSGPLVMVNVDDAIATWVEASSRVTFAPNSSTPVSDAH